MIFFVELVIMQSNFGSSNIADDGHRSKGLTATGPAMVELDSEVARAAIKRDLNCYADQWRLLQEVEVEVAYGPVDPQPADIHELQSLREPRQTRIWDDSFYPSYMLRRRPCYMLSRFPSHVLSRPPSYMRSRTPSHMRRRPPSYMCPRPSAFIFWFSARSSVRSFVRCLFVA